MINTYRVAVLGVAAPRPDVAIVPNDVGAAVVGHFGCHVFTESQRLTLLCCQVTTASYVSVHASEGVLWWICTPGWFRHASLGPIRLYWRSPRFNPF